VGWDSNPLWVANKTQIGMLRWDIGLKVLNFLEEYGFITQDRLHQNIQLKQEVQNFIRKLKWLERAECQGK
jgi:hypothetical protein